MLDESKLNYVIGIGNIEESEKGGVSAYISTAIDADSGFISGVVIDLVNHFNIEDCLSLASNISMLAFKRLLTEGKDESNAIDEASEL